MEAKASGKHWILRLDKGEEIVETLEKFCCEKGIRLGTVSGIGATDRATIGLFKTRTKEYVRKELTGDHEITSLTGNISGMNDEVYLHLHVNLSDANYHAFGGHLNAAVVSATCEVVVRALEGDVGREFSEEIGLNLYKFS
jgi:predicted DNA-binding protein with PD1-like motif